jgi:hypothetical protein
MVMTKNLLTLGPDGKLVATETKTVLAAREDDFARKLEALRRATGRAETHQLRFVCAHSSQYFVVHFERLNPKDKFRVARFEKLSGHSGSAASGTCSPAQVLSCDDFDPVFFPCSYCGTSSGFVWCDHCQTHVCKGRTVLFPGGIESYRCHDGCGAMGVLEPYDKVHAEPHAASLSKIGRPAFSAPQLTPRPSFLSLPPGSAAPRLGGPRR